jgi:hypothetical protein
MTALEELKKRLEEANFNMNRAAEMPAGGKYGAPGIGGEEVLAALLPAGIGMGGRAIGAGVRGFNAAGKRLDPLAEGISGFVTSPSGQQFLGSWAKSALLGKLAKEIENKYGVASQPWLRRELKGDEKRREETAAQHRIFDEERGKIIGDFKDKMPYHREKSQKVVNIGMGATMRDVKAKQIEERKRKEWALTLLDQYQQQGASKKQIDDFIEHSGVAFNPDRESKFLNDAVLGAKEVEQYYPNPEKAEVVDFPSLLMPQSRILRREEDETAAPGLVEKDSQELFRKDPEKWLWRLNSKDVLDRQSVDPDMLTRALEAQGIDPYEFKRFHYLGFDEFDIIPEDVLAGIEAGESDAYIYNNVSGGGAGGMRSEWLNELNALIAGKESGKYPESIMKTLDEGIEASRNIIAKFDEAFGYNAEEDKLKLESNLTGTEFQMLQDIRNKPEGQRLPFERKELLRLESRTRWGKEFELWENWEYDE